LWILDCRLRRCVAIGVQILDFMRLRATVAYDGTNFHGFQRQANTRSVQNELEEALRKTCDEAVSVTGAGRTDAGVHATGQVVAFQTSWSHSLLELQKALNVRLPEDVAVLDLATCDEGFHPRYSARSRTYEYTVLIGQWRQPLMRLYAWQVAHALELGAMNEAAWLLVGEHDFAAFGTAPQGDVTVRTVMRAEWILDKLSACPTLRFTIEANAFLFRMVRRIVVALVQVGRGQLSVTDFSSILASKDSQRLKGTAPACGLCFVKVTY
jgi:tRNA pseudouridine38-40 synthase